MTPAAALLAAVLVLAFWNGANDVSKGIATLVGSGVTRFRTAVIWGTAWTAAGGLTAALAAQGLVKSFSGSGLIAELPTGPAFLLAVAGGAIAWLAVATRTGLPVSTTHAITGALVGAGLVASGTDGIHWAVLGAKFALPLALSPLLAFAAIMVAPALLRRVCGGLQRQCVCLEQRASAGAAYPAGGGAVAYEDATMTDVIVGSTCECSTQPAIVARLNLLDALHWCSAGATSFARGLNDAPKILALGIAAGATLGVTGATGFVVVAVAMAAGALLAGFRVTATLATRVTRLTPENGFAANLVTALVVIGASRLALPVSTTHVSSGAIIGLGLRRGGPGVRWRTVRDMALSWLVTLPVAGLLATGIYKVVG